MSGAFTNARAAIRDFEEQLKARLDVLFDRMAKAIPNHLFLLADAEPAEDDAEVLCIDKADLEAIRNRLNDADEEVYAAFDDLDWEIKRMLADLKQTLGMATHNVVEDLDQ